MDAATGRVCAAGKLHSEDRTSLTRKLTRREGFPVVSIVAVARPQSRPGPPSGPLHSRSRGSHRTGGRRASRGSRGSRPSRSGSGRCSWGESIGVPGGAVKALAAVGRACRPASTSSDPPGSSICRARSPADRDESPRKPGSRYRQQVQSQSTHWQVPVSQQPQQWQPSQPSQAADGETRARRAHSMNADMEKLLENV